MCKLKDEKNYYLPWSQYENQLNYRRKKGKKILCFRDELINLPSFLISKNLNLKIIIKHFFPPSFYVFFVSFFHFYDEECGGEDESIFVEYTAPVSGRKWVGAFLMEIYGVAKNKTRYPINSNG